MEFVDLHTHSIASDGTDAPDVLVRKAAEAGLVAVAVTDHDTVAGLEEAQAQGRDAGVEVIRGCEVSAGSPHGEVHILGLWLPEDVGPLAAVLEDLRRQREKRNLLIVEKLTALGLVMDYDEVLAVAGGETVGRPHIGAVMVRKGYAASMRDVFELWLGSKGKAFVPRRTLELGQCVTMLSGLGATVCLAHPRLIRCPDAWLEETVRMLKPLGLTALEAYHSDHSQADTAFCVSLARTYGLELSGGSDYHGQAKPGIRLGVGRGGLRVPAQLLDALKAARKARGLPL